MPDETGYTPDPEHPWKLFQEIEIIDGPFNKFRGVIHLIERDKKRVRVMVNLWGRETPVELYYAQVKPRGSNPD
jgi:transcription termination/antitermination protein NusG